VRYRKISRHLSIFDKNQIGWRAYCKLEPCVFKDVHIVEDSGLLTESSNSGDHFADKDGNYISAKDAGMPGEWPEELFITIEFEGISPDETRMALSHEGIPKEMHDDCVKGWNESIDKLQKLVELN
jgi:hypothetical protein